MDDDVARYGRVKVSTIIATVNRLRIAIQSGDIVAAQKEWNRMEQWWQVLCLPEVLAKIGKVKE